MPLPEYDYRKYFEHGMSPTEYETTYRDVLNGRLPSDIVDCHVHAAEAQDFDVGKMSDFAWHHMVSTYPETTLEQSEAINQLVLPDRSIKKLRFAHAFAGINHKRVNDYLISESPSKDRVALFGLSDSEEDIEYTVEELRTGNYTGLKMYYMSSPEPKFNLYDYFPKTVLAEAEAQGVPIILHFPRTLSRSIGELEDLVANFPKLQVMLAHVGVTWFVHDGIDKMLEKVSDHKNVFVDTSGVTEKDVVLKALQHLGPNRVLYGSDEPYNILREFSYENPDLGPRILCDHPYHWVDLKEFAEYGHLAPPDMTYSQLQQVDALVTAIGEVANTPSQEDEIIQLIFHDNAQEKFGF
jgi:predicted TIM-barrel fold metal-dependent hydrolase